MCPVHEHNDFERSLWIQTKLEAKIHFKISALRYQLMATHIITFVLKQSWIHILEKFKTIPEFFGIFQSDSTRWKLYADVFVPVRPWRQRHIIVQPRRVNPDRNFDVQIKFMEPNQIWRFSLIYIKHSFLGLNFQVLMWSWLKYNNLCLLLRVVKTLKKHTLFDLNS